MNACRYPHLRGRTGYAKGCRCDRCRASNTNAAKSSRAKRFARSSAGSRDVPHGLYGYLNWGCRCATCAAAHHTDLASRRASRRARIASAPHGTESGYSSWGCRCDACRVAATPRIGARNKKLNDATRDAASHHGEQWTGPELEIALRPDLTATEAARMLGRTVYAVRGQRRLNRIDPRKQSLAGLTTSTQENRS